MQTACPQQTWTDIGTVEDHKRRGMKLLVVNMLAKAADDYRELSSAKVIVDGKINQEWVVKRQDKRKYPHRHLTSEGPPPPVCVLKKRILGYGSISPIQKLIEFWSDTRGIQSWLDAIGSSLSARRMQRAVLDLKRVWIPKHTAVWMR